MMMLRLKEYSDNDYDSCGNTTIAVVEHNSITIPLCEDCVSRFIESVDEFKKHVLCMQCVNWHRSSSGGIRGTCEVKCKEDGRDFNSIPKSDYGYIYATNSMDSCPKGINKNNPSDAIIEDPDEIEKSIDEAMKSLREKKQEETNMSRTLNIINTVKNKIESSKSNNTNTFKVPKIDIHMNPITHSIIVNISNTFTDVTMDKDFTEKDYLYDIIYSMIYCSNPPKDAQSKYTSLIIIGDDPLSDECIEYTDMVLDLFLDSQKELYILFDGDPKFILYTKEDFDAIIGSSKGSIVAMFDIVVTGEAVTNFKLVFKAPNILIYSPHQKAIDVSEYIGFINHYYKIPEEYPLVGQHYTENGELI